MEYAKKMALVDPRILENVAPRLPPVTNVGTALRRLDDEMQEVLDRRDLQEREKVTLYNQVLSRYNDLADKRRDEPVRVVIAKQPGADDVEVKNETNVVPKQEISVEKDIVDSVPKTMKKKAQRLLNKTKSASGVEWNDRGELVYKNTPVTGSNMVDLVNDVLRKGKAFEPQGWQTFARVLKDANIPMDLVQSTRTDDRPGKKEKSRRRRSLQPTALQRLHWEPY